MTVDPTEPIHSEKRTVTTRGSENESLYANITDRASDLIDVEGGDDIIVHSYHGFLLIEPAADGGDHSEC